MIPMNLNSLEDIAGILVTSGGFLYCLVILLRIDALIRGKLPCEKEILKQREERIDHNWHTALLCTFSMFFFTVVLLQWFLKKLDTAPAEIDVQIFMLKCLLTFTLARVSHCSFFNVKNLLKIRGLNVEDCSCPYCPKSEGEKEEGE